MGKRHIPESNSAHPNVTPLIDVVMVLIVFFMLVAKIGISTGADTENIKNIPKTLLGVELKDMGNVLVLNVRPGVGVDEQPLVTALVPSREGGSSQVTELKIRDAQGKEQLVNTLKFFRYGSDLVPKGSGPNADNDNFQVAIRANADLPYKFLEPVLIACAKANVKAVNFNTAKKEVRVAVQP